MREILFRGKRLDTGERVDGNLFIDEKGEKCEILVGYTNYRIAWEVIPETVCQYTGLTDKNGKKIFEGDIVRIASEVITFDGESTYTNTETGTIAYDSMGMLGLIKEHKEQNVWSDFFNVLSLTDTIQSWTFEIIGNIHDDPELLEDK